MFPDKLVSMKPIGYLGLVLMLGGGLGPHLFDVDNTFLRLLGLLLFTIGAFLMLKGRKEHGLG